MLLEKTLTLLGMAIDPDHRSYKVSFDKIESLGYRAKFIAEDGVKEILTRLISGNLERTDRTITLTWYKNLIEWNKVIDDTKLYGGILEI